MHHQSEIERSSSEQLFHVTCENNSTSQPFMTGNQFKSTTHELYILKPYELGTLEF